MALPSILGINRTQDASISIFEGGRHVMSIHKERLSKRKHHWGRLKDIGLYKEHVPAVNRPYDLVVECWSADEEIQKKEQYHEELRTELDFTPNSRIIEISHHLSHLYSAWPPSGFKECAVMIIDSVGSPVEHIKYDYPGKGKTGLFEVASYYYCKDGEVKCIQKQLHDRNPEEPNGLGNFYYKLTECFFEGEGSEGKVMGLAAYGDPSKLDLPELIVEEGAALIPDAWREMFKSWDYAYKQDQKTFQEKADLAARGQDVFEKALIKIADWLSEKTGTKDIAYAGGCALNCVANSKVLEQGYNLFIPPAPHDGGTSVGCAIYGAMEYFKLQNAFNWRTDYLGPDVNIEEVTKLLADYPGLSLHKPDDILEECANHLVKGEILCVYQSNSEFGPRALGNRSIVADTRYAVHKFWINTFVKGREWFRPIAPFVLQEDVNKYFHFDGRSPFMLFTAYLRDAYKNKFPTIEHNDFSARIQTVSEEDNPFIYELIKSFKEKTGVGIITNTSFNGKNETIVETLTDTLNCYARLPIHYLVVPPYIISKKTPVSNPLQLSSSPV
ncbi:carbamoyltransferase [Pontibacter ummariensis]|uniref:Carbamoyltransferase n=1 Tax=Pontibacter ummariensis TaxID=1610492 RepID=A0A239BG02_9BACT|nr:carbamoyltransferase C-terminal domain-containing protein [Pontibacter ummariensis]PRY16544.1 carbamoyltransferase [Pontibacter ummariensis]SNS07047.1 carbamoyltransferase [Pontibacter ummariensis]